MSPPRHIVILGLSITSSWGNGHATTYRGLVRELCNRGHSVLFLERDVPWYGANRDLPHPPYGVTALYANLEELNYAHADAVREADLVIVGSYVPDGIAVIDWVMSQRRGPSAFYDIDTPVTVAALESGDAEYLARRQIPELDIYLSFTAGPLLKRLQTRFGARRAAPLYCSVDHDVYYPEPQELKWDLGYIGTYAADRQPGLERLLIESARQCSEARFVVAGPSYPADIQWPANCERIDHISPADHRRFYNSQRFTLNLTRADMIRAGYSPSVRLFEAAACGVPIISDYWQGLDTLFSIGREIFIAHSASEVLWLLRDLPEAEARTAGERARERVLAEHTAAHRAFELELLMEEALTDSAASMKGPHAARSMKIRSQEEARA